MRTLAASYLVTEASVAFYRRYDHDGVAVDLKWMGIGWQGCGALYRVWVKALNDGVYNRIELMLVGGNVVIVRKLSPEAKGRRELRKQADALACRMMRADLAVGFSKPPELAPDYSSLIAARCLALPGKLNPCPVCDDSKNLAEHDACPVCEAVNKYEARVNHERVAWTYFDWLDQLSPEEQNRLDSRESR